MLSPLALAAAARFENATEPDDPDETEPLVLVLPEVLVPEVPLVLVLPEVLVPEVPLVLVLPEVLVPEVPLVLEVA